jgi:hypothetical protein
LDLHADPAIFEMAVWALAARILEVDKDTVCAWWDRAAPHCRLVMRYRWRDHHVLECQLDELWGFVHIMAGDLSHEPCKVICFMPIGFAISWWTGFQGGGWAHMAYPEETAHGSPLHE